LIILSPSHVLLPPIYKRPSLLCLQGKGAHETNLDDLPADPQVTEQVE